MKIFDWNILADGLDASGKFVVPPNTPLNYSDRLPLILSKIKSCSPDIITLQEVNHFEEIKQELGYTGIHVPKKDSPCLKFNKPPDGVCILWKPSYKLTDSPTTFHYKNSTQCAIILILENEGRRYRVTTTHLKAKPGHSEKRSDQIQELIEVIKSKTDKVDLDIIAGDFNAPPDEPLHNHLSREGYTRAYNEEKDFYTTWKTRETTVKRQIDYLYYRGDYSMVKCHNNKCDNTPETGHPSKDNPSDHLPLTVTFE